MVEAFTTDSIASRSNPQLGVHALTVLRCRSKLEGVLISTTVKDFNAETGLARNPPTVVGPHGNGTDNDNSRRLLDFCISANLRICGSWFRWKNIHTFSWLSNDHKTAKEIDHVLVNRRWNMIMNCRVYRKPEFDSDHRPVIATCRIKLKKQSFTSQPNS